MHSPGLRGHPRLGVRGARPQRARLPRARGAVRGGRGRPRGVPRRRRGGLPGEPVHRL